MFYITVNSFIFIKWLTVMNYLRIYNNIIEKRKYEIPKGYTETHHIIPRSLGGSNKKNNLVKLTAKEHFICHLLLTKLYPKYSFNWYKMLNAFMMMKTSGSNQQRVTSNIYKYFKEYYSKYRSLKMRGSNNIHYGKVWIHNHFLRKSKSVPKQEVSNYLLLGWEVGYVLNWYKHLEIDSKNKIRKKINSEKKKEKLENNIKLFTEYYHIYDTYGWKKFKEITGFNKTNAYLVMAFKRYVKEFVPQNGKKRGKVI